MSEERGWGRTPLLAAAPARVVYPQLQLLYAAASLAPPPPPHHCFAARCGEPSARQGWPAAWQRDEGCAPCLTSPPPPPPPLPPPPPPPPPLPPPLPLPCRRRCRCRGRCCCRRPRWLHPSPAAGSTPPWAALSTWARHVPPLRRPDSSGDDEGWVRQPDSDAEEWADPSGGALSRAFEAAEAGDVAELQEAIGRLDGLSLDTRVRPSAAAACRRLPLPARLPPFQAYPCPCPPCLLRRARTRTPCCTWRACTATPTACACCWPRARAPTSPTPTARCRCTTQPRGGYADIVGMLLDAAPDTLDRGDAEGDTALHNAARGGHSEVVQVRGVRPSRGVGGSGLRAVPRAHRRHPHTLRPRSCCWSAALT